MPGTTTIGVPYPVGTDNNDNPADMLALANWLDPVIEGSYTQAEINAFTSTQRWASRRVYNSTRGCYQYTDGTSWFDEQGVRLNAQIGTTYTLVMADGNSKMVTLSNAAAITLTIPTNATVAFPVGTVISLLSLDAGQVTVSAAGGVTLRAPSGAKLRVQYSMATIVKINTDEWVIGGDVVV